MEKRAIDLNVLFGPYAPEDLDRRNLPQPGLCAGRVNGLEQHLAIHPYDRRERLAGGVCLGHLVVFDPMAIAVIPFRGSQSLYPRRCDKR